MTIYSTARKGLVVSLVLGANVLGCSERQVATVDGQPCDAPTAARPDTGTVVVRGAAGPCSLDFREIVTLRGGLQSGLPRAPVARGPNGQWVSATYDPGAVAVWSASGDLLRTIGKGPGEGPGEFMNVRDLIVDTVAGEVYIFAGAPRIDVYSLEGAHLRYVALPGLAVGGVRLADGTIAATVEPPTPEPFLVMVRGDNLSREGPQQRFVFPPLLRAAGDGVWSAEGPWYEISHHSEPGGDIDFRIKREAPWYDEPTITVSGRGDVINGAISGIAVDSKRQLIMVNMTGLRDPNAPERSVARRGDAGESPMPKPAAERERERRMYYDAVVEAFSMDGRLIASVRFDNPNEAPLPMNSLDSVELWYRTNDDETMSIQILELVLTTAQRGN